MMWLRNIVTEFLRGSNKDLEMIWRLERIMNVESCPKWKGNFFLREGGVQRYPIGFPVCGDC
jgi:hypothetical protein